MLRTALDRFLHLLILEMNDVIFRVCAHKRNNRADEDGDGEHDEIIPHDEKKKAKSTMLSKGRKSGRRRRREAGLSQRQRELWDQAEEVEGLECSCWDILERCVRSYMHVRSPIPGPPNIKLSVLSLLDCLDSASGFRKTPCVRGNFL